MTSPAPTLRFRYLVEGEERATEVSSSEIPIGRGLDNRLVLADPSVSRSHAVIRRGGDGWTVQDLGSTNGITVNGQAVAQAALAPGDVLRVGTVDVRVEAVEAGTAADEEDPDEGILNATIVRRLEDLPGFAAAAAVGDTGLIGPGGAATGALRAGKRRALEAAYSNEVFGHLTRLAANLLTTDSLDQVLAEVIDVAFDALPVDRGFIFLRPADGDGGGGELVCELARHGARVELRPEVSVPVSRTLLRAVVERGVAVVTPDAVDDRRLAGAESVMVHQVRSALAAPLWSGQSIVGAVLLDSTSRAGDFTEADVELATALANFAAVAIERIRYADRAEHERSMRARLERYHSPSVIGEVLSRARSGRLEPKQADVTVLFADLVGFSTFAEAAPPEEVAELLDRFFNDAVDAIFEHGGTLDKFIGDCVMAFFGAPVAQADHARRGLTAARAIRAAMTAWNVERRAAGRLPMQARIALNSGPVVVGEVGAERRVEYTVLGNTVNVAARLEQYAARPGDVVFSEATLAAAEAADEVTLAGERPVATPPIHAESVGPLQLAGLKTPVNVYRLPPEVPS
jgi:adenylate cyclase